MILTATESILQKFMGVSAITGLLLPEAASPHNLHVWFPFKTLKLKILINVETHLPLISMPKEAANT
jgi:hypothetical protein